MKCYGSGFLLISIGVCFGKKEESVDMLLNKQNNNSVGNTYTNPQIKVSIVKHLCQTFELYARLMRLKPIRFLFLTFLTGSIWSAPAVLQDAKFIEKQVSVQLMALINIPITLFTSFLPLLITRYTNNRPMLFFFKLIASG